MKTLRNFIHQSTITKNLKKKKLLHVDKAHKGSIQSINFLRFYINNAYKASGYNGITLNLMKKYLNKDSH